MVFGKNGIMGIKTFGPKVPTSVELWHTTTNIEKVRISGFHTLVPLLFGAKCKWSPMVPINVLVPIYGSKKLPFLGIAGTSKY